MVAIHPRRIVGNWRSGIALDVHTVRSTHLGVNEFGHDVFDTERSELGELLHRLKYRGDRSAVEGIVEAAVGYLMPHRAEFNLILPVPPSTARVVQPVLLLAEGIGTALGVPCIDCVTTTRATAPIKNVTEFAERRALMERLHEVRGKDTAGKNVLLFDDLFQSGATMSAIADLLMGAGGAASVRAFAITATRRGSNR